jgi:DNA invertase Pin-like site-specific DNA recombinase
MSQVTDHGIPRSGSIRAAQYVRKSTDHQKYSIENQSAANHHYAAIRRMEIVRTYADAGKSGLTFDRRAALRQLISDVQTGKTDFTAILVYDVSRWGRFQDADESGYYEYICKRAGLKIHYCAEQFENDGSPFSAIVKSIKRAMAAEYSRELSVKSFAGQSKIFRLGFRAGASAVYGTRRLLVDERGVPKLILSRGQYKGLQTDRIVLISGPPKEIRVVQWIFSAFVRRRKSETEIVAILNKRGIDSGLARPWSYARIHKILKNEVYIGRDYWNRTSIKLGKPKVWNPPELWLQAKLGFAPIITPARFEDAQTILRARHRRPSREELLEKLRQLYEKHGFLDLRLIQKNKTLPSLTFLHRQFGGIRKIHGLIGSKGRLGTNYGVTDGDLLLYLRRLLDKRGYLSEQLIDQSNGVPDVATYLKHFGSLKRAYALIGYAPRPDSHQGRYFKTRALSKEQMLDALRKLLATRGYLTERLIDENGETPTSPTYARRFGSLTKAYSLIGYMPPPRDNQYTGTRGPDSRAGSAK